MPEAREISEDALAEMVRLVDPSWELRDAAPAERGFNAVYRLLVADDDATRELYLKASPDGEDWGIPTEARLQAVLNRHASIPVPTVLGAADAHESLPTPFVCVEALPGEQLAYERVASLDDAVLEQLATDVGQYLGELHSLPAVDGFGPVRHDSPPLTGEQPSGDLGDLTVEDPSTEGTTYLRKYAEHELDRHADSRFSELTPELERWIDAAIDDLSGPFEPVLGRNDHGLHNLLVDPETGAVTAMLDWAYTLAVPPAFDLAFAVYLFGGGFLAGLPDASDRRPLVRDAMLEGYRTTAEKSVPARELASAREPLYELLAAIRIMNDFDSLALPDGNESVVMERIESDVRDVIDG